MAVLLTGGTGQTSTCIARHLEAAQIPFLVASRKSEQNAPSGRATVKFDWLDASTYENPFKHRFSRGEAISALYLIAPMVSDPSTPMIAFLELAIKTYGVKRVVLMTGGSCVKGGRDVGEVWQYLDDSGVQYTALLATWFMDNLSQGQYATSIKEEGKIYTACADGKVPFISANDIGAVAFRALTDKNPLATNIRVLGPELLTYDEVATKLSTVLGREITHIRSPPEEIANRYTKFGMPSEFAQFMVWLETSTAAGAEERMNDNVEKATGKSPQSLDNWLLDNKATWR